MWKPGLGHYYAGGIKGCAVEFVVDAARKMG